MRWQQRAAAKQLCASGKCDSVTISVDYTKDVSDFLNTGIAPYGDRQVTGYDKDKFKGLLKELNGLHAHPETVDCKKGDK